MAFIGILILLAAGFALFMYMRSTKKVEGGGRSRLQGSNVKALPRKEVSVMNLRVNDIFSWMGQDFLVDGKLTLREDGDEWWDQTEPYALTDALGDYAMDYPWYSLGYPQYVALDWTLLRKYEDLIELMHSSGVEFSKFRLIYGFRSPVYNHTAMQRDGEVTLKTWFSMHQYGRAMDMIIDEDGDLVLDDLNGDGFHDVDDAVEVMKYVNVLDRRYREQGRIEMVGGAGLYYDHDFFERPVQSPYVHMDVRGYLAEGNILVRWPANWRSGPQIDWSEIYPEGYVKKEFNYADPMNGSVY